MTQPSIDEQEQICLEEYARFRNLELDTVFSKEPTKFLCIINLGFGGEHSEPLEVIKGIVEQVLGAERIIANKSWPYIYIEFPRKEFSMNAREEINRQTFASLKGRVLFTQYIEEPEKAFD